MNRETQCIMIIDDSASDFEAATRALRKSRIANPIVRCVDGDDALDYLFGRGDYSDPDSCPRPGMILLDLNMPGTDGREVLSILKKDADLKSIPVIVLTTSTDQRDIEACYAMGANSYMSKRIDLQEFMSAIERMTGFWLDIAILPNSPS
ncbi:response regulator [Undibacterium sp.]|uniref:response regulator n=1 Tax=Undibacterium sp. TaxID=1914977 RepID=UPI0037513083